MRVIYPGSFDPPTIGHVAIARRAAALYEEVIVMVIGNPDKHAVLDVWARAALLKKCLGEMPNLRVEIGERLLIDASRNARADAILRGLRSEGDYLAEKSVADAFYKLYGLETVFMQCSPELSFVSSSMVRQLLRLGGDADGLLPSEIEKEVKAAYR
ncbi:MAG: pantetheine-phosphate adenylyltransferase [Clostridia bacterium]